MPCSFCKGPHTINKCNSERLTELNTILEQSLEHGSRYVFNVLQTFTTNELKVMRSTRLRSRVNPRSTSITYIWDLMDLYFLEWRADGSADGRRFDQSEVDAQANELLQLVIEHNMVRDLDPDIAQMMYDNVIVPTYDRMSRQAIIVYTRLRDEYQAVLDKPTYSIIVQQTTEKIPLNATQDCDVCMDCVPSRKFVVFNCNHELCSTCVNKLLKSATGSKNPTCHMCRAVMTNFTAKSSPTFNSVLKILG